MTTTLLHIGRAFTPTAEISDAGILFRDGVIEAIGPRSSMTLPTGAEEVTALDKIAVPGFLDVHIHGAGGHDVMEGSESALTTISKMVAAHGTTSFVATTVTADAEMIRKSTEGISKYIGNQHLSEDARGEVLGVHFEGPFISPRSEE